MIDLAMIVSMFILGISQGMVFSGGLRLTAAAARRMRRPGPLLVASSLLRSALVAGMFYFVLVVKWEMIAPALLGFLAARWVAG